MSDKVWNEHDYQLALSVVGQIQDPTEKERITRKLRQYEQSNITGTGFTGVEAMQAAPMGLTEPEAEKPVDVGAVAKSMAVTPKAGKVGAGSIAGSLWHEPSLERFRLDMAPEVGAAVEQMDESSPLYQAYANRKWNEAAAKAEKDGQDLTRVSQMPTDTWQGQAERAGAWLRDAADTALLGIDESATGGIGNEAASGLLEATGFDPEAGAKAEEALARNPLARGVGNVVGYLNPFAPARIGGSAAIKFLGPKLEALATKAGGSALARGAAKAGTAAAGGAAALATEGAARDVLPQTPGELIEGAGESFANPFAPGGFIQRRAGEAKLGAAAGPVAELAGGLAGKGAEKLAQRTAKRASAATAGLSESDLARIGMLALGGWKIPAVMGAAGRSGPILEQVSKLQSIRGVNPFMPGFPGGAMASPYFQEGTTETPTGQGDAEVIRRAIEEATKAPAETPPEAPTDEIPEGYEVVPEGAGAEPIGFAGDLAESVSNLFGGEKQAPAADYKSDPEFMAMLKKLNAVTDPEQRADVRAGYIRNYKTWRQQADEAKAAGDLNPDLSLKLTGRFDTKGYLKPGESPVAANSQVGAEYDTQETEHGAGIPADKQTQARKEIEKALGPNYTADDIVRQVARRVQVGATSPAPDRVFDAIKQLGFNVPMGDVKRILRGYQEVEL